MTRWPHTSCLNQNYADLEEAAPLKKSNPFLTKCRLSLTDLLHRTFIIHRLHHFLFVTLMSGLPVLSAGWHVVDMKREMPMGCMWSESHSSLSIHWETVAGAVRRSCRGRMFKLQQQNAQNITVCRKISHLSQSQCYVMVQALPEHKDNLVSTFFPLDLWLIWLTSIWLFALTETGNKQRGWLQTISSNPYLYFIFVLNHAGRKVHSVSTDLFLNFKKGIFAFKKDVKKERRQSPFLERVLNRCQALKPISEPISSMLGKYSIMLIIGEVLIQETSLSLPSCQTVLKGIFISAGTKDFSFPGRNDI